MDAWANMPYSDEDIIKYSSGIPYEDEEIITLSNLLFDNPQRVIRADTIFDKSMRYHNSLYIALLFYSFLIKKNSNNICHL